MTASLPRDLRLYPDRPIDQLAIVVRDLEAGMRRWGALLGVSDWVTLDFPARNLRDARLRGVPVEASLRLAFGGRDPQIELVEPGPGPSLAAEHLAARGEGPHHLGVVVRDVDAATAALQAGGLDVLHAARYHDRSGGFAFAAAGDAPGMLLEVYELPDPPFLS